MGVAEAQEGLPTVCRVIQFDLALFLVFFFFFFGPEELKFDFFEIPSFEWAGLGDIFEFEIC